MSYTGQGNRPSEFASKSAHGFVIRDATVQTFLDSCIIPDKSNLTNVALNSIKMEKIACNPINFIITIDGGYTEVSVKKDFPSSQLAFFQIGALIFKVEDLEDISQKPFIDPEDISKLRDIQRIEIVLPTKNITLKQENSLINSVRRTIFEHFLTKPNADKFIDTLQWFIFEEFESNLTSYNLSSCPHCGVTSIKLEKELMRDYLFICPHCKNEIFLTDVFRLHEAIDNELGAGGILGYFTNLIEQMVIVHLIKTILNTKPNILQEALFIKDGPLAFFGQTANMHKPMRKLCNFLESKLNLFLVGLEKSGAFVEHAKAIEGRIKPGEFILIDNEYIYKYIIPGNANTNEPYARTSYYGAKIIFKSPGNSMYVITLPTKDEKIVLNPKKENFKNIDAILNNISKLKCDMYDNSLIPIALVNKLVSLANHPSAVILEKFAKKTINC